MSRRSPGVGHSLGWSPLVAPLVLLLPVRLVLIAVNAGDEQLQPLQLADGGAERDGVAAGLVVTHPSLVPQPRVRSVDDLAGTMLLQARLCCSTCEDDRSHQQVWREPGLRPWMVMYLGLETFELRATPHRHQNRMTLVPRDPNHLAFELVKLRVAEPFLASGPHDWTGGHSVVGGLRQAAPRHP